MLYKFIYILDVNIYRILNIYVELYIFWFPKYVRYTCEYLFRLIAIIGRFFRAFAKPFIILYVKICKNNVYKYKYICNEVYSYHIHIFYLIQKHNTSHNEKNTPVHTFIQAYIRVRVYVSIVAKK